MNKSTSILHHIEFRQLRYFVAAAQHGSFRKASIQIGIRESGISRCVRDLEKRLGAPLFKRCSSGVCLTKAGRCFLDGALRIVTEVGDGMRDVASISQGQIGWIKVGIVSSLSASFTADLLREFSRHHQGVSIEFTEGEPGEHIAAIQRFDLDFAFVPTSVPWQNCELSPLWQERIFVALPQDHHLTLRDYLEWKDLASEMIVLGKACPIPEIHANLIRNISALGYSPRLNVHQISQGSLLALVVIDQCLTLVGESMTAIHFPGVVYRPINDEIVEIGAAWALRNKNPALPYLLRLAKSLSSRSTMSDRSGDKLTK